MDCREVAPNNQGAMRSEIFGQKINYRHPVRILSPLHIFANTPKLPSQTSWAYSAQKVIKILDKNLRVYLDVLLLHLSYQRISLSYGFNCIRHSGQCIMHNILYTFIVVLSTHLHK